MRVAKAVIKWGSILLIVAAAAAGIIAFQADVPSMLIFAMFAVVYVLLPGRFLVGLAGAAGDYLSTRIARSFFMGYALNVLLYFICDLIGTSIPLYVAGPVLAACYLIRKAAGAPKKDEQDGIIKAVRGLPASAYLFTAAVFLYSMVSTQYKYISPEHTPFSFLKIDFAYHAGIINAISQGFPVEDPWVAGRTIQYHYFTELLYSIPVKLFGLTSDTVLMSCAPYLVTAVFVVSLYSFFREMMKREDRIGLYCLATVGANMFMVKGFATSWFMFHMFSNINSAGLGICCLLTMIPLLKTWDEEQDTSAGYRRAILLLLIFTMLMTGTKAPVGIVFVGSLAVTVLLGVLFRKRTRSLFLLVLLSIVAFLMIYVFIIGTDNSNASGGSLLNIGEVTDIVYFKGTLMSMMAGAGIPAALRKILLLAAFVLTFFMAFILPFVIGYLRELFLVFTKRKPYLVSRVTVYACALAGFLGMMILNYSGHSQVYFGFVTLVLTPAIAFWLLEDLKEKKSAAGKLILALFICCLIPTGGMVALHLYEGVQDASGFIEKSSKERKHYLNISGQEYEGMLWLRTHTPEDALIASDRYYSIDLMDYDYANRWDNTHFAYAVYSQRRQYLEGSGFSLDAPDNDLRYQMIETNDKLYDPENDDRGRLARELGVDYVVVSKRFHRVPSLKNEDYSLCFRNEEMDIYQVRN